MSKKMKKVIKTKTRRSCPCFFKNQFALQTNFVPSCQERGAAEVKLSARKERKKGGKVLERRPE